MLGANDGLLSVASLLVGVSGASFEVQAALASAASFVAGGLAPVLELLLAPAALALPALVGVTIVALAVLGMAGARAGGAPPVAASVRVVMRGSLAMAITFAAGKLVYASV